MIRVLDMLRKPVLDPVDHFAVNGHLGDLHDHPELVMFHLVVVAVVAWNCAEARFLKTKMKLHVFLQLFQGGRIFGMLGYLEDVLEQDVVLGIKPGVVHSECFIPDVWLWNVVEKVTFEAEIGVLNMLGEPVLRPFDIFKYHWGVHAFKPNAELCVLVLMLWAVINWDIFVSTAELCLLVVEMLPADFLEMIHLLLIIKMVLHIQHSLKDDNMLLIQTGVVKFERIIPNVWLGSRVMGWQLVLVAEVCVLDVLGQPVRGPVDVLSGYGSGHPGQGSEENVVFFLMSGCATTFSADFKLTLLIIEVISECVSVDIENVDTVGMLSQILQFVEEHLVFLIQAVIENKERFVPYVGIGHMVGHLSFIFEVCIGDVLGKPVFGVIDEFLVHWRLDCSGDCQERVVLVYVLI